MGGRRPRTTLSRVRGLEDGREADSTQQRGDLGAGWHHSPIGLGHPGPRSFRVTRESGKAVGPNSRARETRRGAATRSPPYARKQRGRRWTLAALGRCAPRSSAACDDGALCALGGEPGARSFRASGEPSCFCNARLASRVTPRRFRSQPRTNRTLRVSSARRRSGSSPSIATISGSPTHGSALPGDSKIAQLRSSSPRRER